MQKNLGGRGKTNPYNTVVKRIPDLLESEVDKLIDTLHRQIKTKGLVYYLQGKNMDDRSNDQFSILMPDKLELIEICKHILESKKSAKQSFNKLLQVIYKDDTIQL